MLLHNILRKISSIFLIFLVGSSLSASYVEVRQDSFTLQAGYGTVAAISIKPIAAQTAAYIAGMPFNIEDSLVAPIDGSTASNAGRRIASFNLLSNTDFELEISGGPMMHENADPDTTPAKLDYILTFECQLGVYSGNTIQTRPVDRFTFESKNQTEKWSPLLDYDEKSFVGTVDGYISFIFDDETINYIHENSDNEQNLPAGNYETTVTVKIIAKGDASL